MAPVIGYIATAIAALGVSYAVAYAIAEIIVYVALDLLINAATRKHSKTPGLGGNLTVTYSSTEAALRLIYGNVVCGALEVIPPITTGSDGRWLHKVHAIAGHEVDSFGSVYFDQEVVLDQNISAVSGNTHDGEITGGKYGDSTSHWAQIRRYRGTTSQTVDWKLKNEVSSTAFSDDFKGLGIAYAALVFTYNGDLFKGVPAVTYDVNGAKCYDPRKDSTQSGGSGSHRYNDSTTWEYTTCGPLCLANYLITQTGGAYDPATEIDWASVMAAANVADAIVSTPCDFASFAVDGTAGKSGDVISKSSGSSAWDASIRSTDYITKGEITAIANNLVSRMMFGFSSAPTANASYSNISHGIYFNSNTVTVDIYESGTLKLATGITYTTSTICKIKIDGSTARYFVDGKIVYSSGQASSNLYFDSSLYDVGGSFTINVQRRYTCNGAINAATTPDEFITNVKTLATSFLGRIIYTSGIWKMYAGAWQSPTFSIAKTDWVSPLSIRFDSGLDGRFNRQHGWFIDPDQNWQRVECTPRANATYMANDGGKWIDHEVDDIMCTNQYEMQRKAEFLLRASRNQIVVAGKLGPKWQDLGMWDTGTIVFDDLGWASKTFRVSACVLNPDGTYDVSLTEEQSTDWTDMAASEYNAPDLTPLPAVNYPKPSAPTSLAIDSQVNGTLKFTIGKPLIAPQGTKYRLVRATNSYNASAGTVVYDGTSLLVDLFVPNSQHWYWAQAYVTSYTGDYYPNTYGLEGWPGAVMWTSFVNCVGENRIS